MAAGSVAGLHEQHRVIKPEVMPVVWYRIRKG